MDDIANGVNVVDGVVDSSPATVGLTTSVPTSAIASSFDALPRRLS